MTSPAYLSPDRSPWDNFIQIAKYDARITKVHADLLKRARDPKIHFTSLKTIAAFALSYFISLGIAAKVFNRLAIGVGIAFTSAAVFGFFLYRQICQISEHIKSLQNQLQELKKESEKSKKIYLGILNILAALYIHKANYVFSEVQVEIRRRNLQNIEAIFNTVKKHVDAYDKGIPLFTTEEDIINCLRYRFLKRYAVKLITGVKAIGPCPEFTTLSSCCWEFSYGVGMNPHVHWAPPGEMKRYFLEMVPSDGKWIVRKHQHPILEPF
jgi:hypothetical protein